MNVTLIGMPGVGKSSIGKKLAEGLKFTFLDADEIIEKSAGLKLQQIIDKHGEEIFLKMEQRAIIDLGVIDNHVICPGGSVVYSKEAMRFLKNNSTIIFLNTELKTIKKNINNLTSRGIIGLRGKTLMEIYKERDPLYTKYADITINLPQNLNIQKHVSYIIQALSRC